jgi:hypothetical protein
MLQYKLCLTFYFFKNLCYSITQGIRETIILHPPVAKYFPEHFVYKFWKFMFICQSNRSLIFIQLLSLQTFSSLSHFLHCYVIFYLEADYWFPYFELHVSIKICNHYQVQHVHFLTRVTALLMLIWYFGAPKHWTSNTP